MMANYQTIDYKEKMHSIYQNKINETLSLLPDYCTRYENYLRNKNTIKTRVEYITDIYNFFRYLVIKKADATSTETMPLAVLQKLNGFDFDDYLSWLSNYKFDDADEKEKYKSNSAASKKRKMMAIKSLFHFLYVRDYINCNPSEKAIIPVVKSKRRSSIRILEDEESKIFLKTINDCFDDAVKTIETKPAEKLSATEKIKPALVMRDKAIIYLFLGTGLRVSELCAINCTDINFGLGYINVIRKEDSDDDKQTDKVYLSPEVSHILCKYINEYRDTLKPDDDNYDALFISSKHMRITTRAVELMVKNYANIALGTNNGITPHKLRATFGTRYYKMTGDISATSTAMNHSGIEITAKYYIQEDKNAKEQAKNLKIH